MTARLLDAATSVVYAVTLSRRRHTTTATWSDEQARAMDEIQHAFGSGPCLHAMNSARTGIDLAAGIIMGQNRCTQEEAMAILVKASSSRIRSCGHWRNSSCRQCPSRAPVTHFD
jgi:hypothetical protein